MLDLAFSIFISLVVLPTILIVATPIILIKSFFIKGGYIKTVQENYSRIIKWYTQYIF